MATHGQNHKAILVVGGAGYIGSHLVKHLKDLHYTPIVLDNLSSGKKESVSDVTFFEGDASDEKRLEQIYLKTEFASVIHLAGFIQVNESISHPLKYYQNNLNSTLALLAVMKKYAVKNLVFSSSAAVYGNPTTDGAISEKTPKSPVNPYGKSKWMIEQILEDCAAADDLNVIALRYFNVAGADPSHLTYQRRQRSTHLIPLILQAYAQQTPVTVFGNDYKTRDGSAIRDYIHVKDISAAHELALRILLQSTLPTHYTALNLGTGYGHTVLEVIQMAEAIIGTKIPTLIANRRLGDPESLIADGTLAKQLLGWHPIHSDLKTIIKDAWHLEKRLVPEMELEHAK